MTCTFLQYRESTAYIKGSPSEQGRIEHNKSDARRAETLHQFRYPCKSYMSVALLAVDFLAPIDLKCGHILYLYSFSLT